MHTTQCLRCVHHLIFIDLIWQLPCGNADWRKWLPYPACTCATSLKTCSQLGRPYCVFCLSPVSTSSASPSCDTMLSAWKQYFKPSIFRVGLLMMKTIIRDIETLLHLICSCRNTSGTCLVLVLCYLYWIIILIIIINTCFHIPVKWTAFNNNSLLIMGQLSFNRPI